MTDATQKDLDQDHATRLVKSALNDQAKLIGNLNDAIVGLQLRIKSLEAENEIVNRDLVTVANHLINLSSYAQLKQGLVPLNVGSLAKIKEKRA